MNRLVLSFVTLLMLASRLPGQTGLTPQLGDHYYATPAVCNDGTIPFNVARAYLDSSDLIGYQWEFVGWYNVDPSKCEEIGPSKEYYNGGWFGKDAITLLAFAFSDSTGAWGGVTFEPSGKAFYASNQQFCVRADGFGYRKDSSNGALPRACDGGYKMLSASFEYRGGSTTPGSGRDELHLRLGPNDRATALGIRPSQTSGAASSSQSSRDANPSLCGKVSCWDQFVQSLAQAIKDNEAQRQAAANTAINPPVPQLPPNSQPSRTRQGRTSGAVISPAPAPPANNPIGAGGSITAPPQFNPILCVQAALVQTESWNSPSIGGKMEAFQKVIGQYILSIAKPGTQYWIRMPAYTRFDPALTYNPASLVLQIPPRQQASPGNCGAGYSIFFLQKTGRITCRGCE